MIVGEEKNILLDNNIEEALNGGINSERRNLVFCETLFQLFNTLTIFLKYENHAPVDLVLTDDSDFSQAKSVLEKVNIFENIYSFKVHDSIFDLWQKYKYEERLIIAEDPGSFINDIELKHNYTDLWVNLDTMAPKMFYYKLKNLGMAPIIHFVDEGTSSYILDFSSTKKDFIDHKRIFGELAFSQRLGDMWLNEPRVYSGGNKAIPLYKIPNEILHKQDIVKLYKKIFGEGEIPKEKFIFFEESFVAEGKITNDLDLFRSIVNIVGKENIIVKRHPRNPVDRFSCLGYKVMDGQSVPWEMMILDKDVSSKVLISVGSSATLTPFYLYGMTPKVFLLKKLLIGKIRYLDNPKMSTFFYNIVQLVNNDSTNAFFPSSLKELEAALNYVANTDFKHHDDCPSVENANEKAEKITTDFPLHDFNGVIKIEETSIEKENLEEKQNLTEDNSHGEENEEKELTPEEREVVIENEKSKISTPYMSIVVPVYGTEKYLRRCLDSLVFQTLDNIEIIVVNDGSPDNSQNIIDEYADRFPGKIVPLTKENGGLSSAREFGTKHATGKYIGFVDSDDWVDYKYCEHCFNTLVLEQTKAVVFCVKHVYESGYTANGIVPDDNTIPSIIMKSAASFTSKVYDREFLIKHIKFLNMWYEDIPVINPMLSYLDKISLLKEHLYYYVRERSDSITNSNLDIRQLDYEKAERMAIESTNPKYRKYQLARSISRVMSNKNLSFYDHTINFIKSYKNEIDNEEFLELLNESQQKDLIKILDDQFNIRIPNIIYLNGFECKDLEIRNKIESYYIENSYWNEVKAIWLDESNCDVESNEKIKELFNQSNYSEIIQVFALQRIYESGGVYLSNNIFFSLTLNSLKYNKLFFGFADRFTLLDNIFGGEKENIVIKKILDLYYSTNLSIFDAIYATLIGFVGFNLSGKTQNKMDGICIYSPNILAYKTDESNICSAMSLDDNRSKIMLDKSTYEIMLSYFKSVEKSNIASAKKDKKSIAKLQNKLYKRDAKIEKLKSRVEKRDAKIEKLKGRVEKRDAKIEKLKSRVKKRDAKIEKLKSQVEKRDAKIEKLKNRLTFYNRISKSIVFKTYRKLFKFFHK